MADQQTNFAALSERAASNAPRSWLFGYGSLISLRSRKQTAGNIRGAFFAAIANGLQRDWSLSIRLHASVRQPAVMQGCQALGIRVVDGDAHCNGTVFAVTDEEWQWFAQREQGYLPQIIAWDHIEVIDKRAAKLIQDAISAGESLFCYLQQEPPSRPSAGYPVLQSYLDVILAGCAMISEPFIIQFLRDTGSWPDAPSACVDDRLQPIYPRHCADAYVNRAKWDDWLSRLQPKTLHCRRPLGT